MKVLNAHRGVLTSGGTAADFWGAQEALSPIARWKLEESSGTAASDDIGDYDLTHIGAPTLAVPGPISGMVAVTYGTGKVSRREETLITDYPFTLEAWVRRNSGTYGIGISLTQSDNTLYTYVDSHNTRGNGAVVRNDGSVYGGSQFAAADDSVPSTSWSLIHGVMVSSSLIKLYVDGVFIEDSTVGSSLPSLTRVSLGALDRPSPIYADVTVASPAIYDYALSAANCATLAAAAGL